MNESAQKYWDEFWRGKEQPQNVCAWQFGSDPDGLSQLVIEGKKTATTSCYMLYELENEPIPAVGQYSIILSSKDTPTAIIKTVAVQVIPMNDVPVEHVIAEGEADLSFGYWWNGHKEIFTKELAEFDMVFSDDMLIVCERFELVDVKSVWSATV